MQLGGLVGFNFNGATITDSQAFGPVSATANAIDEMQSASAGGLVGMNQGLITGTTTPLLAAVCASGAAFSCATGTVMVGAHGVGGGLAGFNSGTGNDGKIFNAFASGAVTAAAGLPEHSTNIGGLAGTNFGTIENSHATGAVGTAGVANLNAGGLVGDNGGAITNSYATGTVSVGNNSEAGGLAADNSGPTDFMCSPACNFTATITGSYATGNVVAGTQSVAAGLVGSGDGTFTNTHATGNVSAGAGSLVAGLIGAVAPGGQVASSYATGTASGLGSNSVVGGLAALNVGTITDSTASGPVTGTSESYLGGLVGVNLGAVSSSSATPPVGQNLVSASGANNLVGGLVAMNAGTIDQSFAAGPVVAGNASTVGGLVGANVQLVLPGDLIFSGQITNSHATGAVSGGDNSLIGGLVGASMNLIGNSYATGAVSGGAGSKVGGLAGANSAASVFAPFPAINISNCNEQFCSDLANATLGTTTGSISNSQAIGDILGGLNSAIGGLVGQNDGSITSTTAPTTSTCATGASWSCAGGTVGPATVGGVVVAAGGFVGWNTGAITDAFATGAVSGAGTGEGNHAGLGGLVGHNDSGGVITSSYASGAVTGGAFATAGGLVGHNDGSVIGTLASPSHASGNVMVTGGTESLAGGLIGENQGTINFTFATGQVGGSVSASDSSLQIGGLVGSNFSGSITNSYATGPVSGSGVSTSFVFLGGLAGTNLATISNSYASGNVSSASVNVQIGGLVGYNSIGSIITDSQAFGIVTASANISACSGLNCDFVSAGGLVGANFGLVTGTTTPLPAADCTTGAGFSCASGAVSVGSHGTGGGLVGTNFGTGSNGRIFNAFASGAVTGAAGGSQDHETTFLGGLAGSNQGTIENAHASGPVGTVGLANLSAGGLVSHNGGAITNSYATGNVRAGDGSGAGGLVSENDSPNSFNCAPDCNSSGTIIGSHATGNVTVGAGSVAGGLAGTGYGTFTNSYATGAVSGGGNSILGGFIAVTDISATITNSTASGAVTSTGPNSWVGGFIGANGGTINLSGASGAVAGTSDSLLGGFVGINFGTVMDSTAAATSTVTGTGTNNYVGGFVGVNFGTIDPSTSAGAATGGASNVVGGFAGANAALANLPSGLIPGSSFPVGTITPDSLASGTATGGANSIVGAQVGTSNPTSLPVPPSAIAGCDSGVLCSILQGGFTLVPAEPPQLPQAPPVLPLAITQITPPVDRTATIPAPILASLTTPSGPPGPPPAAAPAPGNVPGRPGFTPPPWPLRPDGFTISGIPPIGESRFLQNQLVMQLNAASLSPALTQLLQQLGIRVVTTDALPSLGGSLVRLELPSGMTVRQALARLEANQFVPLVAPAYVFRLAQPASGNGGKGDPAQYILSKFELAKTHELATGKGVTIAVIDSEVDKRHTELQGAISEELDTLTVKEPPHSHGTAMAGAIASRDRLMGVAPGAKIVAVRAFGESSSSAEGTTVSIVKGIEWAVSQGAKVINMSFAGPRDPLLERALKAAHEKGVVLVAAAGNAGPKSPPLYPAAEPSVIAVTATDVRDRAFRGANQGKQVSVAAPGVDVLAPAPGESYQMQTGTSIATAHVSGVVSLMLERDPTLKPDEVRKILEETATDLGPKGKDLQFGWGLVNPRKALQAVDARLKSSDASAKRR